MINKIVKGLWVLFALAVVGNILFFTAISYGWIGYMPPVEELENPNYKFATEIFSEDGKVLGTWSQSKENRVYTSYDELSPWLVDALTATEDARYADHSGIDAKALARAIIKSGLLRQSNAGGGSTITQQLTKQLYSPKVETFWQRALQKPIEWVMAVKLERYYTKEEIVAMYFNKFDFLNNAVGIKTAAHTYFGKEPHELKIEESALLVGMCKNPSYFNPLRFSERSKGRRNVVLDQMYKYNYITLAQRDSLWQTPLELDYHRVDHKEGMATYLREYLRIIMTADKPVKNDYRGWQAQKFYEDSIAWENDPLYGWCNKNRKKDGTKYSIYTDGLKIYTTINSHMQQYAEEAVEEHIGHDIQEKFFKEKLGRKQAPYSNMLSPAQVNEILYRAARQSDRYRTMDAAGKTDAEIMEAFNTPHEMSVFTWNGVKDTIMSPMDSIRYYKYFLRTGFMSMDPVNGHVKAYVGGPNYTYFQYDMAMVGRRQVGSTIKPFLYSLAMENGYTPCDGTVNVEQTYLDEGGRPWTPRNSSHARYGEYVTLRWGLANSNNWISAYLMNKLSPYALVKLIHAFGVRNKDIEPTISLCLGPCDISVGEMVSAYTSFANHGIRVAPLFVTHIEDNEGNIVATFSPQMDEVISSTSAYQMLTMLRAVINEGTGGRVRRYGITADMGGKTGTTNRNSDGWFIGFTPSLVSGCWVGGEERDIHFDTMLYGQGASLALPIWTIYMKKVYEDPSLPYDQTETFSLPPGFDPCSGTRHSHDPNYWGDDSVEAGLDEYFN